MLTGEGFLLTQCPPQLIPQVLLRLLVPSSRLDQPTGNTLLSVDDIHVCVWFLQQDTLDYRGPRTAFSTFELSSR